MLRILRSSPAVLRWAAIVVLLAYCGIILPLAAVQFAAAKAPDNTDDHVIQYLNSAIEWYRSVTAVDLTGGQAKEVVFRDNARQNALQVLRLGFAFAKADAKLLEDDKAPATAPQPPPAARTAAAAAAAGQRLGQVQHELDDIQTQIRQAPTPPPDALTARRDKLIAELNLAKARNDVLQGLVGFNTGNGMAVGLAQQVEELERSLPELQAARNAEAAPAPPSADTATAQSGESPGLLGQITQIFSLSSRLRDLQALADRTAALKKHNDAFRTPIRGEVQQALRRGEALSQSTDADTPQTLHQQAQELDAVAARYRLVTAAGAPLGEQGIMLDAAATNLQQWRASLAKDYARAVRTLVIRASIIGAAILFLLGLSSLWRRATFRYVSDLRRRKQFLQVRRIIVGTIILMILISGVVSQLSTLATVAGLITAGIAVALQTVILSGVAHFFFFGRYGVRVGDRVTIGGVTGDIIDIGLFRLYLLELGQEGVDNNPTGRIVVFSNSVLFQSSAFYKQIPGTDYGWHQIKLTFTGDTDLKLAESRILDAIGPIFDEYKGSIQQQYAQVRDTLHFQMPPPHPEVRIRFAETGVEFIVRFPVENGRAPEIDDRIARKIHDTICADGSLHLLAFDDTDDKIRH